MRGDAQRRNGARRRERAGGRLPLVLLVAGAVLALAGCGSKSPSVASVAATTAARSTGSAGSTSTTPSTTESGSASVQLQRAAAAYAACMRAHGVPDFPDPSAGGGFEFPAGSFDPSSPAVEAAQAKCRKLLPGGGPPAAGTSTHPTTQWLAHMVAVARCMRRHGIAGFPDPTTTMPSLSGFVGVISNIQGAVFAFPASLDTRSPQFTRAAAACGFPLHNH